MNIQIHFLSPKIIYEPTKKIDVERKYPAFKIVKPYKIIKITKPIVFL